ncbi:MAG TPA: hypothetical protein VFN09_03325 [Rhodanobacteraceae bacterium]|nr:hypothetical protein [Rhodanobacteraceae bacterium]
MVAGSVFASDGSDSRFGVFRLNDDGSVDKQTLERFESGKKAVGARILNLDAGYYLVVDSSVSASNDTDFAARLLAPDFNLRADYADARVIDSQYHIGTPGNITSYDVASDAVLVSPSEVRIAGTSSDQAAIIGIKINWVLSPVLTSSVTFEGNHFDHLTLSQNLVTGTDLNQGVAAVRIAARSDGALLLAARADIWPAPTAGLVMRVDAQGKPTTGFGDSNGEATYAAPMSDGTPSGDTGFAGLLIDAGRPLLFGTSMDTNTTDGVLLRLQSDRIFTDGYEL